MVIYCADIGSVRRNNFGWARLDEHQALSGAHERSSMEALIDSVSDDLSQGQPVALGFECPLFVPISDDPADLTAARDGDGDRAWSAGAGCGSLATGLTQTVWILERILRRVPQRTPMFLEWREFLRARAGLFLWEAFVTKDAKLKTHCDDAEAAARCFHSHLPDVDRHNAIRSNRVRSLIGAALLQAGWSNEIRLLEMPCLVIRVKPNMCLPSTDAAANSVARM